MSEIDKNEIKEQQLEELLELRARVCENSHIAKTCKFFRWLSGKSVNSYSKDIEVSHTYWKELESGIKSNPSYKLKRRIAEVSGLSYENVEFIFANESINFETIYSFIIKELNNYLEELANIEVEDINKKM